MGKRMKDGLFPIISLLFGEFELQYLVHFQVQIFQAFFHNEHCSDRAVQDYHRS